MSLRPLLLMTIRAAALIVVLMPLTLRAQVDIFWNQDGIRRADIDGSNQRSVISRMGDFPVAIAFDRAGGYVFWSELDGRIRRTDADRIVFETIAEIDSVVGLAVDETQGKLYWVVGGSSPAIRRSNLDGSDVETIVSSGLMRPLAISVDPSNDAIYWSDMNRESILGTGVGTVSRAHLDGSSIEQVVADSGLTGMTIDVDNNFLYWSASRSRIRRASLDGTNTETIVDGEHESSPDFVGSGIPQPLRFDLDVSTNTLYWMSRGQSQGFNLGIVASRSVDGGTIRVVGQASWPITYPPYSLLEGPFAVPFDLKINPETDQPAWTYQGANPVGNPDPTVYFSFTGAGVHGHKPRIIKISRSTGEVFWSNDPLDNYQFRARVYRANLDGAAESYVFSEIGEGLNDFLYHSAARTFYASDNRWGLYVFREEEGSEVDIPGVGGQSMALDTVGNKLYWIDGSSEIGRQNLDGSSIEPLVELGDCNPFQDDFCPDDLNLDLAYGRMYWRSGNGIQTAALDGSDVRAVLVESSLVRSFTADWIHRKLYWISAGMLRRSNPDGSAVEDLWSIGDDASNLQILNGESAIGMPMDAAACGPNTGAWSMLAGETFETDFPGAWSAGQVSGVDARWGATTRRANGGPRSAWAVGAGSQSGSASGRYPNNTDTWMTLGPFDLRDASDARFLFDRWVGSNGPDSLIWGASTDGVDFTTIGLSGNLTAWARDGYSMARPETQNILGEERVWIGFRFKSDNSGQDEGAYVDNVCVQKLPKSAGVISAPSLANPPDGQSGASLRPDFRWSVASGATSYRVQVSPDSLFLSIAIDREVQGTGFQPDSGILQPGTTYFWRVRGLSEVGPGPFSSTFSFITVAGGPQQVTLLSPPDLSRGVDLSPTLRWNAVSGAATYQLQISKVPGFTTLVLNVASVAGTEFQATDLDGSTKHYWRVRATNAGSENWSATWSFTTGSGTPDTVTLVSPIDGASNVELELLLSWNQALRSDAYDLQVATDNQFNNRVVDVSTSGTSRMMTELVNGQVYFWRVRGTNSVTDGEWSAVRGFITERGGDTQVILISPEGGATGVPLETELVWHAVEGAASYHVQVATTISFQLESILYEATQHPDTVFQLIDLGPDSTFAWRVKASNAGINNWSITASFVTGKGAPSQVVLESPLDDAVEVDLEPELIWTVPARAASFNLEVALDDNFSTVLVSETGLTEASFTLPPLDPATDYFWRVQGENQDGVGPWSESRKFTTIGVETAAEDEEIPEDFALSQNYPNPFNPSTSIEFAMPRSGEVTLRIYNIRGEEVARLVDGFKSAGRHTVRWDAAFVPSGVYLYRFQADGFAEVRKLTLTK